MAKMGEEKIKTFVFLSIEKSSTNTIKSIVSY